ncbi:MAG: YkgJ family cysteine cluster protein [Deltaproteobacteria bacterium]|nr:YkgJ family cysteine cluster protein [Deltaproteobacteria bacterium]
MVDRSSAPEVLAALGQLHREVDAAAARLVSRHGPRLRCGPGCADCCIDELTVFTVEAAAIRRRYGALLQSATPHPVGACAFLDDERCCRIYHARPYVCRTQGLPLRWIDEGPAGELAELRDICQLNDEGLDLTELEPAACWTLGPVEARLRQLQLRYAAGGLDRIALRELFE